MHIIIWKYSSGKPLPCVQLNENMKEKNPDIMKKQIVSVLVPEFKYHDVKNAFDIVL